MKLKSSILAITAVAGLVVGMLPTVAPAVTAPAAAAVTLPPTIPSLQGWTGATGEWSLTTGSKIVAPAAFSAQAQTFATELDVYLNPAKKQTDTTPATPGAVSVATSGADADDIEVKIDATRATELGVEGYELKVASTGMVITGANIRGAFYGTRSVTQMLRQQLTLPAGSIVDVPKYKERGVTLCACVINIQPDFIDRMLTDMADLKLNHLLLEMKLQTSDARNNIWSYYTKADIQKLVAKAKKLGIDVVPEINSPGHMGIWLQNRPDLQLSNNAGQKQSAQLDISHADALSFYTGLIDQYQDVFDTDYWHMGADEYMIGTSFANYTALTNWAKATYGANATIGDAFIAFINKVNAHVKAKGKSLRIWNDGVISTSVVQLDRDIVVEYWDGAGLGVRTLMDRGYEVMNANGVLYFSRSSLDFKMNSANLWNTNWHVGMFPSWNGTGTVDANDPKIRGAKVSIWPDDSYFQTENEVEAEVYESLRFISQLTWRANHRDAANTDLTWTTFRGNVDKIGRNPLWLNVERRPMGDGIHGIELAGTQLGLSGVDTVAAGAVLDQWVLTATPDFYYQLKSASGKCLAVVNGSKMLGVVTQIGSRAEMAACVNPVGSDRASSNARNTQKWQIIPATGGYRLRNALSNQDLATIVGTEKSIDFSANPATDTALADQSRRPANGTVVQLPADLTNAVWTLLQQAGATASVTPAVVYPGQNATVTVTVRAAGETAMTHVVVAPATAEGFTVTPASVDLGSIAAGGSKTATFTVSGGPAVGSGNIVFNVASSAGAFTPTVVVGSTCGPDFKPTPTGASSQQLTGEKAGSGPVGSAFDGNANTYWHTSWLPTDVPYPHWVTMDAGKTMSLCSINYLPRNDSPNARLKGYEVYVSNDGTNWGTAVASGLLADTSAQSRITFPAVSARYVKLQGLSGQNGADTTPDVWLSAAEISLTGVEVTTPSPTATATPTGGATVTATATVTTTTATVTVTTTVPSTPGRVDVYSTPGFHLVNGRSWYTQCEPYSRTFRCTTQIWATQVKQVNGKFVQIAGWVFNNLTYLPYMTKAQWGTNPLANPGQWSVDGRRWKTECGTECRSYIWTSFIASAKNADGSWRYYRTADWVFNNIVRFKTA